MSCDSHVTQCMAISTPGHLSSEGVEELLPLVLTVELLRLSLSQSQLLLIGYLEPSLFDLLQYFI